MSVKKGGPNWLISELKYRGFAEVENFCGKGTIFSDDKSRTIGVASRQVADGFGGSGSSTYEYWGLVTTVPDEAEKSIRVHLQTVDGTTAVRHSIHPVLIRGTPRRNPQAT